MITPTKETAVKILEIVSHGLVRGIGIPEPGKFCVEAAVCFALGLPHGDNPPCVHPVVRSFKIALNDSQWSNNMARAKGLRRLAIAQLGSESIDSTSFAKELALSCVRKIVPIALRAAGKLNPDSASKLEECSIVCEDARDLRSAYAAANAAACAADAACAAAACAAAAYAAADAACAAADAADAADAACAAGAAACAADAAACAADAADAAACAADARDDVLSIMAECAVEALIKCKSPGCEWLDLCD